MRSEARTSKKNKQCTSKRFNQGYTNDEKHCVINM